MDIKPENSFLSVQFGMDIVLESTFLTVLPDMDIVYMDAFSHWAVWYGMAMDIVPESTFFSKISAVYFPIFDV
ncbi:hypothetical protein HNY73_016957 [Argiope bruennichi]|uniref:Uncharacterized protein n=1 Tax=Argiope bruennichi TaxID=94029 RepID=A0A8T0ELW0_ARGBR|nr:hypothetical protein HNY73_016957 [Argiope bruennichi]